MAARLSLALLAAVLACAPLAPAAMAQGAIAKSKDLPPPPPIPNPDPTAPPEGKAQGGLDFGRWRSANPETNLSAFTAEIARIAPPGTSRISVEARMLANGFDCRDGNRPDGRPVPLLECHRGALEAGCATDWTVEVWSAEPTPKARFSRVCLGERAR
jgi:hypothetical protein